MASSESWLCSCFFEALPAVCRSHNEPQQDRQTLQLQIVNASYSISSLTLIITVIVILRQQSQVTTVEIVCFVGHTPAQRAGCLSNHQAQASHSCMSYGQSHLLGKAHSRGCIRHLYRPLVIANQGEGAMLKSTWRTAHPMHQPSLDEATASPPD